MAKCSRLFYTSTDKSANQFMRGEILLFARNHTHESYQHLYYQQLNLDFYTQKIGKAMKFINEKCFILPH